MTDDYERKSRVALKRIIQLQAENVMLMNAIQNAQFFVAQKKYDEADRVLSDAIRRLLETEAQSIRQ